MHSFPQIARLRSSCSGGGNSKLLSKQEQTPTAAPELLAATPSWAQGSPGGRHGLPTAPRSIHAGCQGSATAARMGKWGTDPEGASCHPDGGEEEHQTPRSHCKGKHPAPPQPLLHRKKTLGQTELLQEKCHPGAAWTAGNTQQGQQIMINC